MKKQWTNHNINLQHLSEVIENRYAKKNFKIKTTTFEKGCQIRIVNTELRSQAAIMDIIIKGIPNNLTIETKATEYEDEAVKLGLSTSIFGGGNLILGNIKAREELEKLEQEFWATIEETIATLTNSR
jgi:hypothetical protein